MKKEEKHNVRLILDKIQENYIITKWLQNLLKYNQAIIMALKWYLAIMYVLACQSPILDFCICICVHEFIWCFTSTCPCMQSLSPSVV